MGLTWHQKTMGVCPHGLAARPYCAVCAMEDKAAVAEQKAEQRRATEHKRLEQTVGKQSAALDDAYAHIRYLRRRQNG